ncbi:MAG: hypothetical protein JSU63_08910, partial [Phycisphaerales bacterium]
LIDGSTLSMPDTPELVEHFGYPSSRQERSAYPNAIRVEPRRAAHDHWSCARHLAFREPRAELGRKVV